MKESNVKLKLLSGDKVYEATPRPKAKGFPHRKIVTTGFWPFKKEHTELDGWEDRGGTKDFTDEKNEVGHMTHTLCHSRTHIGIEDGSPFTFCPMCLIKLT